MADAPVTEEQRAARRLELQRILDKAAEEAGARKAAHDDLVLELRAKYTAELGPQGRDWELVNEDNAGEEGPIVVKMQAADLAGPQHKKWLAVDSSIESQVAYVLPSIAYPDQGKFGTISGKRPGLVARCVAALNKLFGDRQQDAARKF